jgi:hypothetical protein
MNLDKGHIRLKWKSRDQLSLPPEISGQDS